MASSWCTPYDGGEAIDLLKNGSGLIPDLIVTDLKMPKVNGFEFLEWLHVAPDARETSPRWYSLLPDEPAGS